MPSELDGLLIVVDTHKTSYVEFPDLLNYTEKELEYAERKKSELANKKIENKTQEKNENER